MYLKELIAYFANIGDTKTQRAQRFTKFLVQFGVLRVVQLSVLRALVVQKKE